MAASEPPPASLAALIGRHAKVSAVAARSEGAPADALGQFGFSFGDAEISELDAEELDAPSEEAARKLWSVAELVGILRGRLEREYADVWVEGEISNCRPAASGHLYFTLKDGEAQLPVVLFRRQAMLLRWRPEDGMAVLVRGRVSVFESRGQLQLIAETLEPRGAGALQAQFEQLKAKLKAEGLFEQERKTCLPVFPRRVGVITSLQGAVIRDIVTVARRRHAALDILVYPAAVQGAAAAAEIVAGLRYLNQAAAQQDAAAVDLILIARGGGSAEDLSAFNDEALARAIAASALPVVSAVGHETDFTIADFVADLRAPTPSAAAELITAAQHRIEERVDVLRARLLRGIRFQQMSSQQRFSRMAAAAALRRVEDSLQRREQQLDSLRDCLSRAAMSALRFPSDQLRAVTQRLQNSEPRARLQAAAGRLQRLRLHLANRGSTLTAASAARLGSATLRLRMLSPAAVLERGYTLTYNADGHLLRSAKEAVAGRVLITRFADDTVRSEVLPKEKDEA